MASTEHRLALLRELLDSEGDPHQGDAARIARALVKGYVTPDHLRQYRAEIEGKDVGIIDCLLRKGYLTIEQFLDLDSAEPESSLPAESIGKYRLIRLIGRGGMGEVYEAEDEDLKRRVALKTTRDDSPDAELLQRMRREAAIAARLRHPNIVEVYDFGTAKDSRGKELHFIAMEYVAGKTLATLLTEGSLSRRARLEVLVQVAKAVGFAHSQGVLHRDLKPENVLVDEAGRVVLTDFGLAKSEDLFHSRLTLSQTILGTPQYMAPEQVAGKVHQISAPSDVYGLGVMLYEILVGRPPFSGTTPATLYPKILNEEPPAPRRIDPTIERDLETICGKALAKERRKRYADGNEFALELTRFLKGEPISARPTGWPTRLWRRVKRRSLAFAIAGASIAAVFGVAWIWRSGAKRERESREREAALRRVALDAAEAQRLFEAGQAELSDAEATAYDANTAPEEVLAKVAEARGWVEQGLIKAPESPRGRYLLGRLWEAEGDESLAEWNYREAIRLDPAFGMAHYHLGRLLFTRAFLERMDAIGPDKDVSSDAARSSALEAAQELEIARTIPGGRMDERTEELAMAMLDYTQDRWESAVQRGRAAVVKYGNKRGSEEFHLLVGLLSRRCEEKEGAFGAALSIHPKHWLSYLWRGWEHRHHERHLKAVEDFSQLIRIRPRLLYGYQLRAAARAALRDFQGAIADADEIVMRAGSSDKRYLSSGYLLRAFYRRDLGMFALAGEDVDRHLELHDCPEGYLERSKVRMSLNDREGQRRDLEKALAMRPGFVNAHTLRIGISMDQRDWTRMVVDATDAIRDCPEEPFFLYARATAWICLRSWENVKADTQKALALAPADWLHRKSAEDLLAKANRYLKTP